MKLNLFGDICLQNIDWSSYHFDAVLQDVMNNALNVGNLENPITEAATAKPRQAVNLKSPLESLVLLNSFQVVSLANNHIQDYGNAGCQDTLAALDGKGIAHFGLGATQEEALTPRIVEKDGVRVAFLGATRYANSRGCYGTAPENLRRLRKVIRKLKETGCFVVLYFHWGYEYIRIPSPRERKIAHACIDAGADLIVGAHPHVYQAVERYKERMIFYSLGNFIFSSEFGTLSPIPNDPRLWESYVVSLEIHENHSYSAEVRGYQTSDFGVRMYESSENLRLEADIQKASDVLQHGLLTYWRAYYGLSRDIRNKNKKVRKELQQVQKQPFLDKCLIYCSFNSQDLRNFLACQVPWLFK